MLDLSGKLELASLSRILAPIVQRAGVLGLDWLLIGAAARDLVLEHARGCERARATLDLDVAVCVRCWEDYDRLKGAFVKGNGARLHLDTKQRISFPGGAEVDLVPFGGLEEDGEIVWPPEADHRMNVRGLREALDHAEHVLLPESVKIRTLTIEHLTCLKVLAWRDRGHEKRLHDSVDIAYIFKNADRIVCLDELYDSHLELMKECDYDHKTAGIQLLGERLRQTLLPETREALTRILQEECDEAGSLRLVADMRVGGHGLRHLRALRRGVLGSQTA